MRALFRKAVDRLRPLSLHAAVLVGFILLAVPTVYSIFPDELTQQPFWFRVVVTVLWLLLALGVVGSTALRDRRIEEWVKERSRVRQQRRAAAFTATANAMFTPSVHHIPECYEFTLYQVQPDTNELTVVFPKWTGPGLDVRVFEMGRGATGLAWEREGLVVVKGEAVWNTDYGLTDAQQELWRDYQRAVSYPLYEDDLTTKVGVLTAVSKDADDFFETPPGQAVFVAMANHLAVLLSVTGGSIRADG